MRRMTDAVVCEETKIGLRLNTGKTENMKIRTSDASNVIIEDECIQEVEKLVYLGCEVRKGGDVRNEVGIRINKACTAFRKMERVWN